MPVKKIINKNIYRKFPRKKVPKINKLYSKLSSGHLMSPYYGLIRCPFIKGEKNCNLVVFLKENILIILERICWLYGWVYENLERLSYFMTYYIRPAVKWLWYYIFVIYVSCFFVHCLLRFMFLEVFFFFPISGSYIIYSTSMCVI